MKTIVSLFTLIIILHTSNTSAQVQELDFRGAENLYDMMEIYYQSDNANLPDSLKGAINKEIERTFKTWAPRLYPSGDFSVANNALKVVANLAEGNSSNCDNRLKQFIH